MSLVSVNHSTFKIKWTRAEAVLWSPYAFQTCWESLVWSMSQCLNKREASWGPRSNWSSWPAIRRSQGASFKLQGSSQTREYEDIRAALPSSILQSNVKPASWHSGQGITPQKLWLLFAELSQCVHWLLASKTIFGIHTSWTKPGQGSLVRSYINVISLLSFCFEVGGRNIILISPF